MPREDRFDQRLPALPKSPGEQRSEAVSTGVASDRGNGDIAQTDVEAVTKLGLRFGRMVLVRKGRGHHVDLGRLAHRVSPD